VYVNGKKLGSTTNILWEKTAYYVPLSYLDQQMDMSSMKSGSNTNVTYGLKRANVSLTFKPGVDKVWVNGGARTIHTPMLVSNGVAYIGLQLIESIIGVSSTWDPISNAILVFYKPNVQKIDYTNDDSTPTPSPTPTPSTPPGKFKGAVYIDGGVELTAPGVTSVTDTYVPASNSGDFNKIIIDLTHITGNAGALPPGKVFVNKLTYGNGNQANTWRVTIELKKETNYAVKTDYTTGSVKILFGVSNNDPSDPIDDGKFVVVIDAGHGGKDSGAISISNRNEKDLNLQEAKKLADKLATIPNVQVILTRSTDVFIELEERAAIANRNHADLFISIHANKTENASVAGVETYYWDDSTGSKPQSTRSMQSYSFAAIVQNQIFNATGQINRKVRSNNYRVLVKTIVPAVLIETGYLSNRSEEAKLFSTDNQTKLVNAIANAVITYMNQ
jgi:N-acetylmuramoyl-L-alanine amidase